MDLITSFIDIILHLDKYIGIIVDSYGTLTYLLFFLIIFCETGLVITPFLPGDSFLFAAGAFAAIGDLNITILFILLYSGALLGDNLNYWFGRKIGAGVLQKEDLKFIKKEYLLKAHKFYEKHGPTAIIIARFAPIIRTFSPFVAGISEMTYSKFLKFSILGGGLWVSLFLLGGYFFGNIPLIKHNFTFVIFGIIGISLLPVIISLFKQKNSTKTLKEQ
ncbi:membrane protein [Clostridium polyendosporum]|uniref:Membrane protein n=1 Tax=Clostridium polyendosporum TaxID=69208 RepID=A0A919S2E8_9CLOT|nr:VTT domain-containing protein [Clostridium polyendosporum]GIM29348.1 membrane protein [Clostridium polyendosporum]